MGGFRRRLHGFAALAVLSTAAVVLLALGVTGAQAAKLTGAGAAKNCASPVVVGDPVVCTYAFTNQDDFGNNEVVNSLVDVTQTAGGAQSSGNIFGSVGWIFDPTPAGGTNPNAFPTCTGGSGLGTDASPYFGATSCTVPVSIVNLFGTDFTVGARIRSAPFSWYTTTPADFGLPGHNLSDQDDFTWKCTVGNGSSCDPNANSHATAPATVTLVQRPSQTETTIHNAAHQAVTVVEVGTTVHDFVHVFSSNPDPNPANALTGNVNIDWFTNGNCTAPAAANSGSVGPINPATGTFDASGFAFTPTTPGMYSFKAHYEGNNEYVPSDGACEPLQVVDANITITPDATNEVGHAHTFTVTVKANDGSGSGFQPIAGASVSTAIANSNGATSQMAGGTCGAGSGLTGSGSTNASGQCTVIINSSTAGLTVANASASVTIAGVTVTRDTDPATATVAGPGGSGPATKQYVDARITIAPDKTNAVGQQHTFTATVEQNDGLTAAQGGDGVTGFAPVSGAPVTITLTPSNGATPLPAGPFSGTTDAAGHFSATFNSATAGLVTANASTTFSITGLFNNVTVTRDTDPATPATSGTGGSGPSTKQYVDARITITPDATNEVGKPHTFTATVQQDDGLTAAQGGDGVTGFGPAANVPVTITLTASNGAAPSPAGPFNLTTNASGQAQATFTSPSAGLVVANASTTFSIAGLFNSVSVSRDTDPATITTAGPGGSGPATKQFVDANITITPANATNPTGASHTFTVTVKQDDGLTAAQGGDGVTGFTPAAGAAVTSSIANSNGATSSMTGGTCGNTSGTTGSGVTNASGQCTIIITSPTAGVTTANASATFSITGLFNSVSVTRDTDPATATIGAGPGGSGPANKLWILTHVHNTAHTDITNQTVNAPATVHDQFTTGTTGTPPGGSVTFTLFQSANCTGTIVQVGGQNTESVNLANGSAESTATTLNPAANTSYSYLAHYNGDGTYPAQDASCEPFNVRVADATIAIAPNATNEVGNSHTFTVTFHSTTGDNITAVNNIAITVTPAPSTPASACAPLSGIGTPTVTCTTTINSSSAGLFTAHAAADIVMGGATVHRETTGAGGNSGDAQKQYVDARINITPANATNPTGASHTFTVTVQQDDGLTAAQGGDGVTGFKAVSGAAVTTSIANSNGATSSMTGGTCGNTSGTTGSGTTNASGQCTIIITSPTAGLTTANASATFSITGLFNNVSVTRDTNPSTANIGAGPGGSGPANKLWILTHVHDTAHNDITGTSVNAPATVHDQFTTGSTAGGAPPAGTVTFTLFQSGNCTGTIVQVGGNNAETVNVVGGLAESTATMLNPASDTQYSYLAHYNGDGTFPAQDASCEPFTVKAGAKGQIAPTQTTCSDYTGGTSQTLGQVNYSVSGGKIGQGINPGVFFFYSEIKTTVPNQVVTITQSNNSTNNAALFGILNGQAWLWTGDCASKIIGTTSNGDANASFTVATPGTYVISLKYSTKTIAGTNAPVPADITYTWVTSLGGSTGASVLLKKQ